MKKLFAELYGRATGANSGLAGSQDISYSKNNFFSGAILSGATAIATGTALSLSMKSSNNNVVVAGFGDAATDEGIFWESLNYAGLKEFQAGEITAEQFNNRLAEILLDPSNKNNSLLSMLAPK